MHCQKSGLNCMSNAKIHIYIQQFLCVMIFFCINKNNDKIKLMMAYIHDHYAGNM